MTTLHQFFAQQDNRPPRNVKKMNPQRFFRYDHGRYTLEMQTSCKNAGGAMKLELYDELSGENKPVMVKRCQVDNWKEAYAEFDKAKVLLSTESLI